MVTKLKPLKKLGQSKSENKVQNNDKNTPPEKQLEQTPSNNSVSVDVKKADSPASTTSQSTGSKPVKISIGLSSKKPADTGKTSAVQSAANNSSDNTPESSAGSSSNSDNKDSKPVSGEVNTGGGLNLSIKKAVTLKDSIEKQEAERLADRENTLRDLKFEFPERFTQIEGFDSAKFEQNLSMIHEKMQQDTPEIGTFCAEIYKDIKNFPEVAMLLSNSQIGLIVGGLRAIKKIEISAKKPAKSSNKFFEGKSTEDIMNVEF